MPTKSANNATGLNYISYDVSNNTIDFSIPIVTNNSSVPIETTLTNTSVHANSAFHSVNTHPILNRAQFIQANNSINFNVAITANGSTIAGGGQSPFLLMGA